MVLAIAKLIRIEKAFFNALSIFFPILYLTKDISLSIKSSIPVFCIQAAGFIINDIHDIERDIINNPSRVLPRQNISLNTAIFIYYLFLAISLLAIKLLIPFNYLFIYLLYLILVTNYNYVVTGYPYLKNLYVVLVAFVHCSILYFLVTISPYILLGLILNILCKEIYSDIRDLNGDGDTFPKLIGIKNVGNIVAFNQLLLVGILFIFLYKNSSLLHFLSFVIVCSAFVASLVVWTKFRIQKAKSLIDILTLQHFAIYGFLL